MNAKLFFSLAFFILLSGCDRSEKQSYQGYVEGENIYLASPYSGILTNLAVVRGQEVKKGQLLFQLDSNPQILIIKQHEANLQQALDVLYDLQKPRRVPEIQAIEAQIAQTNAQLELAAVRVKRYQELYRKKVVNKDTLDEIVARYNELARLKAQYEANLNLAKLGSREEQIKAQQAQVKEISERVAEAKWQLAQKTSYAPAAGVIFDTYFRVGEFVGAQQAVLSLLTPNNVYLQFFVPVEELAHLKIGQKFSFQCYGCVEKAQATIVYISPEAEFVPPLVYGRENRDKLVFRIKARLPNFGQFKPGQPVTVYLHEKE